MYFVCFCFLRWFAFGFRWFVCFAAHCLCCCGLFGGGLRCVFGLISVWLPLLWLGSFVGFGGFCCIGSCLWELRVWGFVVGIVVFRIS